MMIALAFAASAALAAAEAPHRVTLDHGGTQVHVSYAPRIETRMKTVGMAAGTRMSGERCRWTASVQVERTVQGSAGHALSKRLAGERAMEGSHPGACMTARRAVNAAIAARTDRIRAHVEQVAAADRPAVLAELESARAVALN